MGLFHIKNRHIFSPRLNWFAGQLHHLSNNTSNMLNLDRHDHGIYFQFKDTKTHSEVM